MGACEPRMQEGIGQGANVTCDNLRSTLDLDIDSNPVYRGEDHKVNDRSAARLLPPVGSVQRSS